MYGTAQEFLPLSYQPLYVKALLRIKGTICTNLND